MSEVASVGAVSRASPPPSRPAFFWPPDILQCEVSPRTESPAALIYGRPARTVTLSAAELLAVLDAKRVESP